eukprot:CAMPEP_0172754992 /NCGR_PEP_ID=MMETSP1074-20121228/159064_1 /TAXON_ID=2916 /ORGANISM="Ceratium fusus, Strain PA161109" /LENGTH=352 /DNA_ID=CAMNT_0013588019 /DNA_START=83 /DNA_END=1141 /DNA_ORIENTATION=-
MVVFFLYSAAGVAQQHAGAPWWVILGVALGGFVVLILTILVHEFGHGLTARRLGGEILYILLWPLGGLCVHTMPQNRSVPEKLRNDWWVTFNGPLTHIFMTPTWIAICASLFNAFNMNQYTTSDLWADLDPRAPGGGLARHPEASERAGWAGVLLLQLCSTAVSLNVILFLFNVLFPMYPMDSSKLLVTGLQLCGTRPQRAARVFIWVSGVCACLLLSLAAVYLYSWTMKHRGKDDFERMVQMISMGLVPLPLHVMLTVGLGLWGGNQTWELYKLASEKRLHHHPLFCHVDHTSRLIRDLANGRPDVFVEDRIDRYEGDDESGADRGRLPAPPEARQTNGAVRLVNGRIVRD